MTDPGDKTLDLSGAKHDVWLVKVPKYLATQWLNAPDGMSVGKLRITKNAGRAEVTYSMDKNLTQANSSEKFLATDHKFVLQGTCGQSLAVFSTTSGSNQKGEKRAMEGRVVQKVDCRPIVSHNYMQLKRAQMIEASKPQRTTKQLAEAVKTVYKPVTKIKEQIEYDAMKKEKGKKMRVDKDVLQSILFNAFEKHQYYNIKDLQNITQQPVPFLKEVLREIGMYNKHPGHRHMWELKPEYRHDKVEEKKEDSDDIDSS
uniref:General transcription factor IIF subunit 2 n=1 Tax=Ciona intestinalis TaxID=7719 RepID=F6SEF1_CIOIN|nr:general transcription factor IIF subunit 2 [Ciona intestinalis]|eukprot:XP_002119394.2 general transcription factor IIF subunit 2 [Ciona intestinalis]